MGDVYENCGEDSMLKKEVCNLVKAFERSKRPWTAPVGGEGIVGNGDGVDIEALGWMIGYSRRGYGRRGSSHARRLFSVPKIYTTFGQQQIFV